MKKVLIKYFPKINFIGLEINDSQMVKAVERLRNQNLNNLRLINIKNLEGRENFPTFVV